MPDAATIAGHPMSTLAPRSDLANWCYGMLMEVTAWDALILVIVIVAFILAVFVFSTRVGEAGPPTCGKFRLEPSKSHGRWVPR